MKLQSGYDMTKVPSKFFSLALNALLHLNDARSDLIGNQAIASTNNSSERMTIAIWEAGSSTDGEADFYYDVQA